MLFKPSASSLATPSFIALGAPSTNSFASLRPNPVNSFTSLTTANLEPPADFKITSNSDFSSAPPSASPPAGPATATAAAAGSIPYSFFKFQLIHLLLLQLSLLTVQQKLLNLPFFLLFNFKLFIH